MKDILNVSIMLVLEGIYQPVHAKVEVDYEIEGAGFIVPTRRVVVNELTVLECEQMSAKELERLYEEDLIDAAEEVLLARYRRNRRRA